MTIVRHLPELPTTHAVSHEGDIFPVDLGIVCLWSLVGLMFSGFFFAWSSGVDIAQALVAAG